jgi:hypothetical protein
MRSVPQFSECARDKSFRPFLFDRSRLAPFFQCGKGFFDFTIDRKSARIGFRKDHAPVDEHVELAGFARRDLRLLAELRIK